MIYDERIHTLKMIATHYLAFGRSVQIYIRGYGFKEGIFDLKTIEWEEVEPAKQPEEFFNISIETAQELMNSLWECGLRPAQGTGSAGQLETMKAHLEDMRVIVANKLKIDLAEKKQSAPR